MKAAKIVVALALVLLLATFGIDNIGGDTWVSAGTPLPPGWMSNPHPVIPRPAQPSVFLPGLIVVVLVLVTAFDAVIRTPAEIIDDTADPDGTLPHP